MSSHFSLVLQYNLNRYLRYRKLTIEGLASLSGVHSSDIEGMITLSENKPKMDTIRAIADGLDIKWFELLKPISNSVKVLHVSCDGNAEDHAEFIDSVKTDIENYNMLIGILKGEV
jgi:transcriptional regulator with XRE-family HTH domain